MKLVWCPETASKAYISAVRSLSNITEEQDTTAAGLIAALAGGWNSQLTLYAPSLISSTPLSVPAAISAALHHTHGRHVTVGEDEARGSLAEGVDFMVVDMRRRDAGRLVREAAVGPRGMVVVCLNVERVGIREGSSSSSAAGIVVGKGMRMVRSAYLPIGRGVEIFHVGVGKGPRIGGGCGRRWLKHVDSVTREEHLFRK